jgi:diacylglycerol kinase (ATP)
MNEAGLPQKKIVFIVNPISGKGKQVRIEEYLAKCLDKSKFRYKVILTTKQGEATVITHNAIAEGADFIVAVGGDGTVNEVGKALAGTNTPLGIIPTGSGNGLARHLNIPTDFRKSIAILNKGKVVRIDTAKIDEELFISIAGMGFDAFVAKKFAKQGKRGFWTYFKVAITSYVGYRPKKYILEIDGKVIERRALLISFANSSQFGNNASIDPDAQVDDGLIDVCIVKKLPFWKMLFIGPMLMTKHFDRSRYVEIIPAREVHVKRKKARTIHLDGDPKKGRKEFTMKIHPLSLHIIVP